MAYKSTQVLLYYLLEPERILVDAVMPEQYGVAIALFSHSHDVVVLMGGRLCSLC